MEVLEIKHIIEDAIVNGIDYEAYTKLMQLYVQNECSSSGDDENLVHYTKLNAARMHRLDKTLKIENTSIADIVSYPKKVIWITITESWCGDAAQVIPVVAKIASYNSNITLKFVLRDQNEALMNQFLTNGAKSIPVVIAVDAASLEVINTFGPRPSILRQMVLDFKAKNGMLTDEFKTDMQRWYTKDKGQTTLKELIAKLLQ